MNGLICLCGRDYPLRFTINAVCALEEKLGGLSGLMRTEVSALRALLWCGLLEGGEKLSLTECGALLQRHLESGGNLKAVSTALANAMTDAGFFPRPAENADQTAKA